MTDSSVNVSTIDAGVKITSLETSVKVTGLPGVKGDKGEAGDSNYTHNQLTKSTVWTINHNLGKYPSIQLLTVGSVEFFADITHTSINQSIVTMATATAGIAQCN